MSAPKGRVYWSRIPAVDTRLKIGTAWMHEKCKYWGKIINFEHVEHRGTYSVRVSPLHTVARSWGIDVVHMPPAERSRADRKPHEGLFHKAYNMHCYSVKLNDLMNARWRHLRGILKHLTTTHGCDFYQCKHGRETRTLFQNQRFIFINRSWVINHDFWLEGRYHGIAYNWLATWLFRSFSNNWL